MADPALEHDRALKSGVCAHCGQPLGGSPDAYCCAGCRAVAGILRSASLERFYALRGKTGVRPTLLDASRRDRLWLAPMEQAIGESEGSYTLTLDVGGMHCSGCVWVLQELFRREAHGEQVLVNPALGRCELRVRRGFELAHYVANVEALGYQMGPAGKLEAPEDQRLLIRVGVTALLASNAMMLAIAQYLGLSEEPLRTTVATLEVVLALATVAVGAPPFFRATWEGLRKGVLHLDLPIAVGLSLALVGTLVAFARTGDPSFADTLAVFVALMLVGRFLERGALAKNRHRLLASEGIEGIFARVQGDDGEARVVRAETIVGGARLLVATGEVVPVDAEASHRGRISLDWLTGESEPVEIAPGDVVRAGAINAAASPLLCTSRTAFAESGLVELLKREAPGALDERARGFFHRISVIWVVGVLSAAALTLLGHALFGDLVAGFESATALLVITCPCAIGIATPLAYQLAVGELRRAGVVVRRVRTLDRLIDVDTLAFDKTGTLTTGQLRVAPERVEALDPDERARLSALVAHSGHPKSEALRRALSSLPRGAEPPSPALVTHEIAGSGVVAEHDAQTLRLGRPAWALEGDEAAIEALAPDVDLVFSVDGALRASFVTDEELRPDVRAELAQLAARGYRIAILSGDRKERVRRVAEALGLAAIGVREDDVIGELSPEDKAAWLLREGRRALFVGDGINDSLAADVAYVSATPSIERPFLPAKTDFVFVDPGMAPVRWTILAAERVRRVARGNLLFALVYNVFGVTLAALGLVHPWVAAVLMPASSVFVVGRTLLAFRSGLADTQRAPSSQRARARTERPADAPMPLPTSERGLA